MPQQVVPIRLFIDSQHASEQVTLCYARYCHRHYNQLGTNNALNCLIVDCLFVIKLDYSPINFRLLSIAPRRVSVSLPIFSSKKTCRARQ